MESKARKSVDYIVIESFSVMVSSWWAYEPDQNLIGGNVSTDKGLYSWTNVTF